jgi:hypothetical protein
MGTPYGARIAESSSQGQKNPGTTKSSEHKEKKLSRILQLTLLSSLIISFSHFQTNEYYTRERAKYINAAMLKDSELRYIAMTKHGKEKVLFIRSKIISGDLYMHQHRWHDAQLHLDPTPIQLTQGYENLGDFRQLSEYEHGYLDGQFDIRNPNTRYIQRGSSTTH